MKRNRLYNGILLLGIILIVSSFCGNADDLYVGSIPCFPYIREKLRIPDKLNCEFIKWKVTMHGNLTWQATILYGESQANTNGFKRGGLKLDITGKYFVTDISKNESPAYFYTLTAEEFSGPIYIRRIHPNLLHFADDSKKLLAGDGGFSFTLNLSGQP